eukprot:1155443-Pelagomonas_calceolata.AAC.10
MGWAWRRWTPFVGVHLCDCLDCPALPQARPALHQTLPCSPAAPIAISWPSGVSECTRQQCQ